MSTPYVSTQSGYQGLPFLDAAGPRLSRRAKPFPEDAQENGGEHDTAMTPNTHGLRPSKNQQ